MNTWKILRNYRGLTAMVAAYFLALSATILLLQNGLNIFLDFKNQQKYVIAQQQTLAQNAANTVGNFIQQKLEALKKAAVLGNFAAADPRQAKLILDKLLGMEPLFRKLALLDVAGRQRVVDSRLSMGVSNRLLQDDWNKIASNSGRSETYISPTFVDPATNEPMIVVTVPVLDALGDEKGILLAELNLKFMWDLIDNLNSADQGRAYVVDRRGDLIAYRDVSRVLQAENLRRLGEVDDFINHSVTAAKSEVRTARGIQGNYVVATLVPLGTPDWAVVVETPLGKAYAPVINLLKVSLGTTLLGLALAVISGVFLARRITRPVISLRDAARRISAGELAVEVGNESKNEIGDLAASFNQMVSNLRQSTVSIDELRKEQKRFYDITLMAGELIWEVDATGHYTYCSPTVEKILGYRTEEVLGKHYSEFYHPSKRAEMRKAVDDMMAGRKPIRSVLVPRTHKDGRMAYLVTNGIPVIGAEGELLGYRGVNTDVTEQKQAEMALQESEERYRHQVELAPEAILLLEKHRISAINHAGVELLGAKAKGDVLGRPIQDFLEERTRDFGLERIRQCEAENKADIVAKIWLHALDGNAKETEVSFSPLPTRGGQTVQLSIRDVTHLRALERQAAESRKLESVGQLAAGIAHEINTPIQFIGDNLTFIREAVGDLLLLLAKYRALVPEPGEEIREAEQDADLPYIVEHVPRSIESSVEGLGRVTTIVRAMKEFAHPDDKIQVPVDLNRAIQSTLTIARNEYKYVAELEVDLGELPPVTCQAGEINQAILNIVVNAAHAIADVVKGSTQKGRIGVSTRVDGDSVVISISDSGAGIPEAIQNRVFDPFFTTKEVGRGTGQGLAIARSVIVDKHRGSISFDTAPGRGTTFHIRLPIQDDPRGEQAG